MPEWLSIARPLPMTYNRPQGTNMEPPILGVVLHTTDAERGAQTLERFQSDWQAKQNQSTHFMVDRDGNIGQFRALSEIAWHIHGLSKRYIAIEHIAKFLHNPRRVQPLEVAQIDKSAKLIVELAKIYGFPLEPMAKPGEKGIGVHEQFENTWCGAGVFCKKVDRFSFPDDFLETYFSVVVKAANRLQRERQGPPGYERGFPPMPTVPGLSQGPGRPIVPRWI
jgi:N-acetylmuramoyl-L-alanine amidase-like protein